MSKRSFRQEPRLVTGTPRNPSIFISHLLFNKAQYSVQTMSPLAPIPVHVFAQKQLELLKQEHEAEVSSSTLANTTAAASPSTRRTLQATGYALTGIVLAQCRTGFGGRIVGEFTADPAMVSTSAKSDGKDSNERTDSEGRPRLAAHGIRVGDIVRVNDISSGTPKKKEKGKDAGKSTGNADEKGLEGVVTRVGERSVWVAFGQTGGGSSRSKEDDEAIEELWGKKLWLYGREFCSQPSGRSIGYGC